uniref:Uncharacterized protein n=1 Tax=viral metagenome TaxID=1070528 RepID=A0A6C0CT49_9ZZZZ
MSELEQKYGVWWEEEETIESNQITTKQQKIYLFFSADPKEIENEKIIQNMHK